MDVFLRLWISDFCPYLGVKPECRASILRPGVNHGRETINLEIGGFACVQIIQGHREMFFQFRGFSMHSVPFTVNYQGFSWIHIPPKAIVFFCANISMNSYLKQRFNLKHHFGIKSPSSHLKSSFSLELRDTWTAKIEPFKYQLNPLEPLVIKFYLMIF